MGETLEYSIQLVDALTPVLEGILEALGSLGEQMTAVSEVISEGMDVSAESTATLAEAMDELTSIVDIAAVAVDNNTVALDANMVALDEVTAAYAEAGASADEFTASEDAADSSAKGMSSSGLLSIVTMLGMAGFAFLKMGVTAESTFANIQVFSGASQDQMQQYENTVDQMAITFGKSTTDMANGLYDIVSVGYKGADALTILNDSAMAAAAGGVDLHTVTNGLTAILQAYSLSASQASDVTDLLMMGVRDGKADFGDFANAFSLVATTAHGAGFSLNDAAAALSTLTLVFPDARQAGQDLNFLMRAIGINVGHVADVAKQLGLNFDATKFSTMDLGDRLQYLMEITHGNQDEMLKLTGGAAGYAAAQVLLTNNGKTYNGILEDMQHKTGLTASGFATASQTMAMHAGRLMGALSGLADRVQQLASPVINGALDALASTFGGLASLIEQHSEIMGPILAGLAGIIAVVLVPAIASLVGGLLVTVGSAVLAAAPFIALAGVLVGLGVALKNAYDHSAPFRAVIDSLRQAFQSLGNPLSNVQQLLSSPAIQGGLQKIQQAAGELGKVLASNLISSIRQMLDLFKNGIEPAIKQLEPHFLQLAGILTGTLIPGILHVVTSVAQGAGSLQKSLTPVIEKILPLITQFAGFLSDQLGKAIKAIMPDIEKAGATVGQFAKDLGDRLGPAINNIVGFIQNVLLPIWKAAWPGIQQVFASAWQAIKGIFETVWSLVSGLIKIGLDIIGGNWGQAWSDIKDMFAGVWKGIQDILGGILGAIGGYIKEALGVIQMIWGHIWDWVKAKVGGILSGILHTISGWINSAVNFFKQLGANILQAIENGFNAIKQKIQDAINFIAGLFEWLYNHNYYFKALVDAIHAAFQWIHDKVIEIWNAIKKFLSDAWATIKKDAAAAWEWVKQHIIKPVQDAWNWLVGVWNHAISWLQGVWKTIGDDAKQLWTNFTNAISSTWNNVTGWIHDHIVKPISDTIGKLISGALDWGKNLIQQFIDGILSKIDDLKNALGNIADAVKKFLGFHSPTEEGPGAESHTWAPNFMKMFASTMLESLPAVEQATQTVASRLQTKFTPHLTTTVGASQAGPAASGVPLVSSASQTPTGIKELHIHIEPKGSFRDGMALMNGAQQDRFARQIAEALAKEKSLQSIGNWGYSGT